MERSFAFIGGALDDASLQTREAKLCVLGVLGGEKTCDVPAKPRRYSQSMECKTMSLVVMPRGSVTRA